MTGPLPTVTPKRATSPVGVVDGEYSAKLEYKEKSSRRLNRLVEEGVAARER